MCPVGVKGARGGDDGSYKREGDEEVVRLGRTGNKCRKIRKHVTETSFEVPLTILTFRLLEQDVQYTIKIYRDEMNLPDK